MSAVPSPSRWEDLFSIAMRIIRQANATKDDWALGGGTALMLHIWHRESFDIDIFVADPQWLPLLNPLTQDYELDLQPSNYDTDGARVLKLTFSGIGEIDFISCAPLTSPDCAQREICGQHVMLENPSEILAKKIYYRGQRLQPRDMFDIAATVAHSNREGLLQALHPYKQQCAVAADTAERMDSEFATAIMRQLIIHEPFTYLPDTAQKITIDFLREVSA